MKIEDTLAWQCKVAGLPIPEREYRFHPTRRWRFDLAWPSDLFRLALEVDGGMYSARSGHRSYTGVLRDIEKINAATLLGWRVLRCTPAQVKSGDALTLIEKAIRREGP